MISISISNSIGSGVRDGIDPEARAFLVATGTISDPTITSAINTLVVGLKDEGIWDLMSAIYPVVGGTANAHKYNLKNPLDTDAAYRMIFSSGWTHSSNGMTPNGAAYANTFMIPVSVVTSNSASLSIYTKTNTNETAFDMGISGGGSETYLNWRAGGNRFAAVNSGGGIYNTTTDTKGLLMNNRRNSTEVEIYYRQSLFQTINLSAGVPSSFYPIYIGARNVNNTPEFFSTKQIAFAHYGLGLTQAQALNYANLVQEFQTELGRQE